jgi:hypothetical protein
MALICVGWMKVLTSLNLKIQRLLTLLIFEKPQSTQSDIFTARIANSDD